MINLKLKFGDEYKNVEIIEEHLFNAYLLRHPELIKNLIHSIVFKYKISKSYYTIINSFIEFSDTHISLYPGLIARVGLNRYAVLYLQGSKIDEDYMISIIKEFIYDKGESIPDEICIDKFEIDKGTFLEASKNI